jgi:hypothetical protein
MASYYPPRIATISQLRSLYPHNEVIDEDEEDWLEHHNVARSRGKGTPKKKRTAAGKLTRDNRERCALTAGRIEEIQQAQVGEHNATVRWTIEYRACIRTVNEALNGVLWQVSVMYTYQMVYTGHMGLNLPAFLTIICS